MKECSVSSKDASSIIGGGAGKVEDVEKKTIKSCLSIGNASELKCPLENSIKVNFNLQDDLDKEVDEDAMMPLNMSQMSD